jgi:3-oxoacyl-[acyl-carrier protein] reductase
MAKALTGKTGLVTGGSRGIGAAIAKRLAREGADVAISYATSPEKAEAVVKELTAQGVRAAAFKADQAVPSQVEALVKSVVQKFGKLDILVNNAGVIRDTLMARMTEEQWKEVIDTNLTSVFNFCQAATMPMMSARYGRMINMSSVASEFGNKGQANYAASKGGVEGFTKCLATELASRNVTVNAVAPGFIETDMTLAVRNAAEAEIKKRIPAKRLGKPEDIANAVAFLAAEETSYITGQVLRVDGGLTLGGF